MKEPSFFGDKMFALGTEFKPIKQIIRHCKRR
jgi:hypothetical protein